MSQSDRNQYRVHSLCAVEVKEYTPDMTDPKEYAPCTATYSLNERSSSSEESQFKDLPSDDDLPPVDGGLYAWLFLLASSMLEAIVWGERLSVREQIGGCLCEFEC